MGGIDYAPLKLPSLLLSIRIRRAMRSVQLLLRVELKIKPLTSTVFASFCMTIPAYLGLAWASIQASA
jgi:hypothetical protein